ncbi:MAG: hypothetical protein IPN08_15750 [Bacteroidales bacterium]|nr:hypothetical protein [Bacteroidales bacterium]
MKEKVLQWIEDGCDYNHGLTLLAETGKHKSLIRSITGREHRYTNKLKYELCKAAGLQYLPVPGDKKDPADLPEEKGKNKIPEEVEQVIKEHSKLFNLRAQLHEQMASLPEDNEDETVKKRKNLSDSIEIMSARIDLLFAAKEAFYKEHKLPNLSVLFPEAPANPPAAEPLPEDPKELRKLKKNLQTNNTKDQNQLDYQDDKKAAKPNPMPSGPKRLKLETRIKDRHVQIEQIDYKLIS